MKWIDQGFCNIREVDEELIKLMNKKTLKRNPTVYRIHNIRENL